MYYAVLAGFWQSNCSLQFKMQILFYWLPVVFSHDAFAILLYKIQKIEYFIGALGALFSQLKVIFYLNGNQWHNI